LSVDSFRYVQVELIFEEASAQKPTNAKARGKQAKQAKKRKARREQQQQQQQQQLYIALNDGKDKAKDLYRTQ
jgi:hypothetical protein